MNTMLKKRMFTAIFSQTVLLFSCSIEPKDAEIEITPLMIENISYVLQAIEREQKCSFNSEKAKNSYEFDEGSQDKGLKRTEVNNCLVDFTKEMQLNNGCDENKIILSGSLTFSGKRVQRGRLVKNGEKYSLTVYQTQHTEYEIQIDLDNLKIYMPHRKKQLTMVRGHLSFIAKPRFADSKDGFCSEITPYLDLEKIRWSFGGARVEEEDVENIEADIGDSEVSAQYGNYDNEKRTIKYFGHMIVLGEKFNFGENYDEGREYTISKDQESNDLFKDEYICEDRFLITDSDADLEFSCME